jgi:hypothetical protein
MGRFRLAVTYCGIVNRQIASILWALESGNSFRRALLKVQYCRGFLRLRPVNPVLRFASLRLSKVFKNRPKRKLIEGWVRVNHVLFPVIQRSSLPRVLSRRGSSSCPPTCWKDVDNSSQPGCTKKVSDNHRIWERWRWGVTMTIHRPTTAANLVGPEGPWPRTAFSG